jgi:hypothetical protein
MKYELHSHRFADVVLNSDYPLKQEIKQVIAAVSFDAVRAEFKNKNEKRTAAAQPRAQGKQSTINALLKKEFSARGWQTEKNVFNDPENDLVIDFWKRSVGVDVAFNNRSSIGGDLLRLQAAAKVTNIINIGVYICPTKEFAKEVSPKDCTTMVVFERAKWYFEKFDALLTAPVLLIGLTG